MDDHVLDLQVYANSVTSRHLGKEWQYGEIRKTEKKHDTENSKRTEPPERNRFTAPDHNSWSRTWIESNIYKLFTNRLDQNYSLSVPSTPDSITSDSLALANLVASLDVTLASLCCRFRHT